MLATLPDSLIFEVFQYLGTFESEKFLQLSNNFRNVITPLARFHFSFNGYRHSKDEEYLSKYLEKYGKHIKNLSVQNLSPSTVSILGKHCTNVIYLSAFFLPGDSLAEEAFFIVELASQLKSLESAQFVGCYLSYLNLVQPIVNQVSRLTLILSEAMWTGEKTTYDGPGSDTVKTLQIFNLRFYKDDFPEFISKFKNVEQVSISHTKLPEGDSRVISYDVKSSKAFRFISGTSKNLITVEPEIIAENTILKTSDPKDVGKHIKLPELYDVLASDDFQSIISNDLKPPHCILSNLGSRRESLENFWKSYSESKVIAIKIMGKEINQISVPSGLFAAKSVSFRVSDGLPATYFKWLATCFPNLEDLRLTKNSALVIQEYRAGEFQFKNLKRIFSREDHTVGFWKKMVASSPNLFQINLLPESSLRPRLQALFPDILFGYYRPISPLNSELMVHINDFFHSV